MRPDRRDLALLLAIVETCRDIQNMTQSLSYETFVQSRPAQMVVERGIEIIGDSVNHLSADFKEGWPGIPWHKIVGQRNVIAHGYTAIDYEQVWTTVTEPVGPLYDALEPLVRAG